MHLTRLRRPTLSVASLLALTALAPAQPPCSLAVAPGHALAGADGVVSLCRPWDPDGPGPAPLLILAGGGFRVAGDVISPFLAAYEPGTRQWLGFNPSLPGACTAIATAPNGRLVVAALTNGVLEWNGSTWQPLGPTFDQAVAALIIMPNGDVVAGGSFRTIGSAPIHGIARWDGTTWQPMGAPTVPWSLGNIDRIEQLPNGDLVAIGLFHQIGGVPCSLIARWDGTTWSPFGGGSTSTPMSVAATTTGEVIAVGTFTTPTGTARFARWNGTAWIDIGAGLPLNWAALAALPNGKVLALSAVGIWAWNGTAWSQFAPGGNNTHCACAISGSDVLFGGSFAPSTSVPARNVARWNGSVWQAPNIGNVSAINTVSALPDGSFVAGGAFTSIGGLTANRLARFDGTAWTPIPSSAVATVRFSIARPDGEVVVVGEFPNGLGGVDFVMTWRNGGQIAPLQSGVWGTRLVRNLALAANGDVLMGYLDVATFLSGIARYDGTAVTFSPIGASGINALLDLPNGDTLVAGFFPGSSHSLMRWDGTQLTPFGTALNNGVLALALAPNGEVIAGGSFGVPARIARWDGAAWKPFGTGLTDSVTSLVALPDGDVIACERRAINGVWNSRVRRWDGVVWTQLSDAVGQADVVWSASGTAALFGEFTQVGSTASAYFARLRSTCPAGVLDRGGGCVGTSGPVTLAVLDRAWIGAPLRTRASGLPAGSLSIGAFGLAAQSVPLALLHPQGAPGCNLLTTIDLTLQFAVVGGAATPTLAVPNAAALVGAVFQHQLIGVEVGASGSVTAVTSSNALQFTIGAL